MLMLGGNDYERGEGYERRKHIQGGLSSRDRGGVHLLHRPPTGGLVEMKDKVRRNAILQLAGMFGILGICLSLAIRFLI